MSVRDNKQLQDPILYFAYGSNMSMRRISRRVPSVRKVALAKLSGYRLLMHKISHRDGSAKCDAWHTDLHEDFILGILYRIARHEMADLDRHEGLGKGYLKKTVTVDLQQSVQQDAFLYYATDIDPTLKPYHWYREHVLRGARENSFPADYMAVLESFEAIADPDSARTRSELSIYR